MASQRRQEVWYALLDAEMNEVYWSREAQRFGTQGRFLAMAAAIASSGTVLALFGSYPFVGKLIACVASLVSIVHAHFYQTVRLKQVTTLSARWKEIAIDYRLLWGECKEEDALDEKAWGKFETISRREKQIDESAFMVNTKRLKQAQEQVCISRGLKYEHK